MIFLPLLCTRKRKEKGNLSRGVCDSSKEFLKVFLKKNNSKSLVE